MLIHLMMTNVRYVFMLMIIMNYTLMMVNPMLNYLKIGSKKDKNEFRSHVFR